MNIVAAPSTSPFKGLAAFSDTELDALFFFGREREREILVANLFASRLTVLYGESGVGKSSLLAAAVVRDLRATAPDAVVTLIGTWSELPEDALEGISGAAEAYLILDQFEEYFLYHGDAAEHGSLLHELPDLLHESRVNVLIAIREDSLARLDTLKSRIPAVFANQVRLEHLDRSAARRAILGPLDRWNEVAPDDRVGVESALVEAVLDECAIVGSDRIEAPYLQLVLERIWEWERRKGSAILRLETLHELGGARTIVRDHLHGALELLDSNEQDVAASMFEHLVTPSGTKIAHRASDLAQYADVPEETLRRVLTTLSRDRIVHSVDGSDRYEIFHDVLAEPIRGWRQQRRLDRERLIARNRQRRLLTLVVLSLCALAGVGVLAVWALSERGTAESQARHAHARELEATALQQLSLDPNHSVRLALEAARLEQGAAAETVLRQALIADRLRLVKHTDGPVRAVATSPRGDLVAAALPAGEVLILNAHNRRLVRRFIAPRDVAALSFSDDGRTLVTASPVGLAQVWDVKTGRRLAAQSRVVAAHTPEGSLRLIPVQGALESEIPHVRSLSVTSDGSAAAVAITEPGGVVRAWLLDGHGRLVRILPRRGVTDVEFSPDGSLLATATSDGFTFLWNAHTGRLVRTIVDARSGVAVIAFSPDGRLLASGGEDSGVRVWRVATGERVFFLFGHTNPVSVLAWSPDGGVLASGSADRTVLLWRMRGLAGAGSLAATLAGMGGAVRALAFSSDGRELLTGGDDRAVRFWDARPDEELELLGRADGPALAARWAGTTIVGLWRGALQTYDARTHRLLHVFRPVGGSAFTALGVSRDGSIIGAGTDAGGTTVWDGRTGTQLATHVGGAPVTAVGVSPNGDLVASGDAGGMLHVWKARGGAMWVGRQHGRVAAVAFSDDDTEIATAGTQGVAVWSALSGQRLHMLGSPEGVASATFSPDGSLIASAGLDDNARIWFARSGRLYRLFRGHTRPLTDAEFSADGRLLVTAGRDSDVRVWGVAKGLGHVLQRRAFGAVSSVAFDPSGRWVAAAAPISVIIWSANGRQLFYVRGHKAVLTGISFAPDSATVLSSSRDGTIRTYRCSVCVDLSTLVHIAEVQLARTR